MKKYLYPFVFSVLAVSGCGKDTEAPLVLGGIYQAGPTTLVATPIRMYTKNGEVNNPALVDHFIKRQSWVSGTFSRKDIAATGTNVLTLTIRSNKRATLTNTNAAGVDSIQAEVLAQEPASFVLANLDSAGVLLAGGAPAGCGRLAELIRNVYPGKRCKALSSASGYSSYCRIRPVRVITIKGHQLFIPQFSWLVVSGQFSTTDCGLAYGNEWNTFNPAILNQLVAGDTIVVQEREIPLPKK